MISRALHWLVTCFPALNTDWLHIFLHLALTGYMLSRALHWLVTCFPALNTDWLHTFPRLALTGYTFSHAWHRQVTCFPHFTPNGYMFSCVFHLLNGFQTLRPVTRSIARGTGHTGQVLLNEFDFDLISWLHGSHYHSSKLPSRQRLT